MKKTLARALWLVTISSFALSSCQNKEASLESGDITESTTEWEPMEAEEADNSAAGSTGTSMLTKSRSRSARGKVAALSAPMPASVVTGGVHQGRMAPTSPMPKPTRVQADITTGDSYKDHGKNPFVDTADDHLSTFAVDVDTASYAIARRRILANTMPQQASVRVEEFVNYFKYDYAGPASKKPFAVHMDMAPSPFAKNKQLLRVGVQAKKLSLRERKAANLVFLVDVSGSMQAPDKLGLAKRALRVMVDNLKDGDTVSLVTYAGNTRVVLEPTGLERKAHIVSAIEDLQAGGSTAMASGMTLAYDLAAKTLGPDSLSRVIVLSDGDANVGATNHESILKTIRGKVKEGVTMSTVGFGMGNYQDHLMEQLANKGNGNYYYIDGINQAKRVFQEQLGGTLEVVAKDVKIQVDFDEDVVKSYRLVGYENRDIADQDFRDDKVDAGEIGAGHTVTAIYELELKRKSAIPVTVRLRAKAPKGTKAIESAHAFDLANAYASFDGASSDFRFATSVMAAAEILRGSEHADSWSFDQVLRIAKASSGDAAERQEFISLIEKARGVQKLAVR